jgi:hypothetical protein
MTALGGSKSLIRFHANHVAAIDASTVSHACGFFFFKGQIHQAIDTENIRRRQLTIINRKEQNPRSVTTFAISFLMARAADEKGHLASYGIESVSAVWCLVSLCLLYNYIVNRDRAHVKSENALSPSFLSTLRGVLKVVESAG